jgi:hypothetical protein
LTFAELIFLDYIIDQARQTLKLAFGALLLFERLLMPIAELHSQL